MKYFIIIDMQNDFTTGVLANSDAVAIIPKIVEMTKQKKAEGYTIIATRDTHFQDYMETQEGKNLPVPHCIEGTDGWEVVDELKPFVDIFVNKPNFGYDNWTFYLTKIRLDKPEAIEMCGTVSEICVINNALILKSQFPEVPIKVYKNLCVGLSKEAHEAVMIVMKASQVEVE